MALKTLVSGIVIQAVADEDLHLAQLRFVEKISDTEQVTGDDFHCENFGTSDFDQAGFINHLEVVAKDSVPDLNFKFQQGACQVRYEPYEYTSGRRRRRRTRPRYHEAFPPAMEHQSLYCADVARVCANSCGLAGGCIGFEVMLQRQHPEYAWCRIFAEKNETVFGWKNDERLPINGAGPWLSVLRARTKEREYPNRASTGIDTADGTSTNFCMGLPSPTPENQPTPAPTPAPPTQPPTPLPTPPPTPAPPTPAPPTPAPTSFPTARIDETPAPTPPADDTPSPTPSTPSPTPCETCPECTESTTPAPPTPAPTPCEDRPVHNDDYMLNGVTSISTLKKGTTDGDIRYPNVKVKVGGVKRTLDLLMHPLTEWRGKGCNSGHQCTAGGYDAIGGMGMINLEISNTESDYEFEFRFVEPGADKASTPVNVDDVHVEFFDLDRGNDDVVEKVIVKAKDVARKDIEYGYKVEFVDESAPDQGGQYGFVAAEYGDGKNNPTSLVSLDEIQWGLRAKIHYHQVGAFSVKFGVGKRKKGTGGRNFFFSLADYWPC